MARNLSCCCIAMLCFAFLLLSCQNPAGDSNNSDVTTSGGESNESSENGSNTEENTSNDDSFEITDFSFVLNPLKIRASNAAQETVVGTILNITGGTAPYTYSFSVGDGINDADNSHFKIDGAQVKINDAILPPSIYRFRLSVTDSNDEIFAKDVSITIYPDPLTAEQEIRNVNEASLAMRYISPGSFSIPDIFDYTMTVDIDISKGYWMSETEVTQELYQSIMGYNPSMHNGDPALGENQNKRPVENISFIEAKVFCNRLSQLFLMEPVYQSDSITDWLSITHDSINSIDKGSLIESPTADGFRIPSEYEWRWAAFGADIGGFSSNGYKKYYSGGLIESWDGFDDHVWHLDNSDRKTHEVGKKSANEAGIYDMSGNVMEFISNGKTVGGCAFYNDKQIQHCFTYQADVFYPQDPHNLAGIRLVSNR